ncbi:hypothetical protein HRR83_001674 [Exophiala dermatitidis]|uniref:Uncharacterized protein n=1 Tax=Exophiala dermatitidis TaxID=5970 RepID=A0AAN6F1A7_EXODE|nr:hypothetical protein HRR73_004808 [Exophiala dermatitidis]KAJ4526480.1 hypothetical protein HRR74_001678 [Exophiala dermatitidis]KAJ4567445.1 hypothetical protein HRR79_004962 [Exophiala dermatitidis]KAJ4570454.1 hypothetical protein HRR81_005882 [Exophiala dermatitidis]KAJ4580713.1 hypothetical protein HRR82_004377 [Exophiala dermatitidis]
MGLHYCLEGLRSSYLRLATLRKVAATRGDMELESIITELSIRASNVVFPMVVLPPLFLAKSESQPQSQHYPYNHDHDSDVDTDSDSYDYDTDHDSDSYDYDTNRHDSDSNSDSNHQAHDDTDTDSRSTDTETDTPSTDTDTDSDSDTITTTLSPTTITRRTNPDPLLLAYFTTHLLPPSGLLAHLPTATTTPTQLFHTYRAIGSTTLDNFEIRVHRAVVALEMEIRELEDIVCG